MTDKAKTIWVDLLCWGSIKELRKICRSHSVEKIYYFNAVEPASFYLSLVRRFTGKPVEQVKRIVSGELRAANGQSLYECVQRRLEDVLVNWTKQADVRQAAQQFCAKYGYDTERYTEHLAEATYAQLYRPVEMAVLAENISGCGNSVCLLRSSAFDNIARLINPKLNVRFYRTWFAQRMAIKGRPAYHYDSLNRDYYQDRLSFLGKSFSSWIGQSLLGVIFSIVFRSKDKTHESKANIALELTQNRVRLDEKNDLCWIIDSGVARDTILGLQLKDYDEGSIKILKEQGIKRYLLVKEISDPIKLARYLRRNGLSGLENIRVISDGLYGVKTFAVMKDLFLALFSWNAKGWLKYQEAFYHGRTLLWTSIYKRLGIKIVWTMYDIDPDKNVKCQAIANLSGLSASSHWSINSIGRLDIQKRSDVFFAWGDFIQNDKTYSHRFMDTYVVGYLSDHYFQERKVKSSGLKNRFKNKFVISYFDNTLRNDIPYSEGMQVAVCKMFIAILKKYDNVVVLLKPKFTENSVVLAKELPGLEGFLRDGKMVAFHSESASAKLAPAEIGMASDLAVGLGVSTAAAECFFAGAIAFHADMTDCVNNSFARQGSGKIVFNDVNALQSAIEARITGQDRSTHSDHRHYYNMLDPFQDGQAFRRMGFVMKKLQEGLQRGMSREETISWAREQYEAQFAVSVKAEAV